MTPQQAREFAQQWLEAWNMHDVRRLLSFCAPGVETRSPLVADVAGAPGGVARGHAEVGAYWEKMLLRVPGLHIELVDVLSGGAQDLVVLLRRPNGGLAAQAIEFDDAGKVRSVAAYYAL